RPRAQAARTATPLGLRRAVQLQGTVHADDGGHPGQADCPSAAGALRCRGGLRIRASGRERHVKPIEQVMRTAPVIPVLVIEDASTARELAEALVAGGLRVLEVTLRTPAAIEAIRRMN